MARADGGDRGDGVTILAQAGSEVVGIAVVGGAAGSIAATTGGIAGITGFVIGGEIGAITGVQLAGDLPGVPAAGGRRASAGSVARWSPVR